MAIKQLLTLGSSSWGWKGFAILGTVVVLVIVIIVVVAVEVTKKNKYPDYSKLNYSLVDTCTFL
jgi:tetrahydromethanopterin S-methyltransferase subunit E